MSYSMWGAFAETPWWIYPGFLWLLFISFQATKPQIASFKALVLYPAILMGILFILMPIVLHLNPYKISIMLLAIFPGLFFGYLQFHFQKIKALKKTSQFYVPGSWSIFVVLFALVIAKFYYYNYAINFDLSSLHQEKTSSLIILLCGFAIGLQAAKSYCLYRCMKVGPYRE